jgi:hypothetical protein
MVLFHRFQSAMNFCGLSFRWVKVSIPPLDFNSCRAPHGNKRRNPVIFHSIITNSIANKTRARADPLFTVSSTFNFIPMKLQTLVAEAVRTSPWDVGNEVLYALCRTKPTHTNNDEVIAKVWLIGRAYAAAIERTRYKTEENDRFYIDKVGPKILSSPIDTWLIEARLHDKPSAASLPTMLRVHQQTTKLFKEISGLEKRSLASKYLHFHCPQLFFIYDTRAVEALRLPPLKGLIADARNLALESDTEYRNFSGKCLSLQLKILSEYGVELNPRQLDSLLLQVHEKR